jgi:glycopeptide antibiotics resistance protein
MSIDDLLLNTLGGAVGVFLAQQFGRRVHRHRYLNDCEKSHPAGPGG